MMNIIIQALWIIFTILISGARTRPIVPLSRNNINMKYSENTIQEMESKNNIEDITVLQLSQSFWERFIIIVFLAGVPFFIILHHVYFRKLIRRSCFTLANWFNNVPEVDLTLKPCVLHQIDNNYFILQMCP